MNIYLIPYYFTRYVVVGLYTGGAALMTWWLTLFVIVVVGPVAWDWGVWWSQSAEAVAMLANLSAVLALCSMWGEGELRRRKLPLRIATSVFATGSVWASVAASQGDETALRNRERIARLINDHQLETARTLAAEWIAKYNRP